MLEEGPDQHRRSPTAEANGARPKEKKEGAEETEEGQGHGGGQREHDRGQKM